MGHWHHYSPKHKALRIVGMAIFGLVSAVVFGFIFGWFVQQLWNWLMPDLFHIGKITFWQGFGIILLARLIFGSFSSHGNRPHRYHHSHDDHNWDGKWDRDHWKGKGCWKEWDHYDEWWNSEGKKAFADYIDRMKNAEKSKESE